MCGNIWIIGHWCSWNMGDRFQPYTIIYSLFKNRTDGCDIYAPMKSIYFVNLYNDKDGLIMSTQIGNHKHKIYSPYDPSDQLPPADFAIMTTGSMYSDSKYISWVTDYLNAGRIKKLVIWGGFSVGNQSVESFSKKLSFLCNEKITYYARSFSDLNVYRKIVKNNRSGRLAGDPMCFWAYDSDSSLYGYALENLSGDIYGELIPKQLKGTVVVPSTYAFEYDSTFWTQACEKADHIICIDSSADEHIVKKYKHKALIIREPWRFCTAIKTTAHLFSGRLHSAVISACINIPTTMIIIDNASSGEKSFKFDAVGNTAVADHNGSICRVISATNAGIDIDNCLQRKPLLKSVNTTKYNQLTKESLDLLHQIIVATLAN